MQANQIIASLNKEERTIILLPYKYHEYFKEQINGCLFNVSIYSPDMLVSEVLANENILYKPDSSLIKKIMINDKLKNSDYYLNNNYIEQLLKLETEFNKANLVCESEFSAYLTLEAYDFSNVFCSCERLLVFEEDLFRIHYQIIDQLKKQNVKIEYIKNVNHSSSYYEYENTIEMLNVVFASLVNKDKPTLVICDDQVNKDYLKNLADNYGVNYGEVQQEDIAKQIKLQRVFNEIEQGVISLDKSDYHLYLASLYELLVNLEYFDLAYLNNLFSALYTNVSVDISLLNNWLLLELSSKLKTNTTGTIIFASSDFNSLYFEDVIVVDASLKQFKAKKASYLLNTDQRKALNEHLLTNIDYNNAHKQAELRLVNCGKNIQYHYCLLALDNTNNDLAYFIKNLNNLLSLNKEDYLSNVANLTYYLNDIKVTANIADDNPIKLNANTTLTLSPSALDVFYNCPYKYFMAYLVKKNTPVQFNSALVGNVVHDIISTINKLLISNNNNYSDYQDNITDLIHSSTIYQASLALIDDYYTDYYFNSIYQLINNFINDMQTISAESSFKIIASEQAHQVALETENAVLKGKIDAIYQYNNDYIIVDYKSSKQTFNYKKLELGLQNQLISYLYLNNKPAELCGAFYLNFKKAKEEIKNSNQWQDFKNKTTINKLRGILFYDNQRITLDGPQIYHFDHTLGTDNTTSKISNVKTALSKEVTPEKLASTKDLILPLNILTDCYFKTLTTHINTMITNIRAGVLAAQPYELNSCNYCEYQKVCKNYQPEFKKEEDANNE